MKFAEVLGQMGADVTWTENSVTVRGPPRNSPGKKHLRAVDVNMNKMPDVAMTLAVVALFADGPTTIRDGTVLAPFLGGIKGVLDWQSFPWKTWKICAHIFW